MSLPKSVKLENATTGSVTLDFQGYTTTVTCHCTGSGTISGGTILLEEAESSSYSGTWSLLATVTASDLTGGKVKTLHVVESKYNSIRLRISSDITGGGTVTLSIR